MTSRSSLPALPIPALAVAAPDANFASAPNDSRFTLCGRVALPLERYHIPRLIYDGDHRGGIDTVASQIDVAPTILALLNMDYESAFFGKTCWRSPPAMAALISNYQSLGLYRPGLLSVLSPNRKIEDHRHPESARPEVVHRLAPNRLDRESIVYYQSASYCYTHRLNAWPMRAAQPIH